MVRELSKHQSASCLIVAFVIARFASLSCYSSAKTRIRPVKSYQMMEGRKIISLTKNLLKIQPDPSDTPAVCIKSRHDDCPTSSKPLPEFNPEDLVGRTFLLPPGDNGERLRAKVTRKVVEDIEKADGERIQNLSYTLGIGNGKVEELISYNQLVDHLEAAANEDNNRSLPLWTLLAVLWLMCHIWITKGTVRRITITMRKSYGA